MKLRCAIIDDEPLALTVLEGLIKKIPNVEVVAKFNDVLLVYDFLSQTQIDFLFLDVEMPNLSGIDFIRSLSHPPLVVITSANKNYAIEGFELNVADYILKPVSFERVLKAINKIIELKSTKVQPLPSDSSEFIYLKENKRTIRIHIGDILYIESVKDYSKVMLKDRAVLTKQTISHFEEILSPKEFMRVHRSFIIAIRQIHAYSCSSIEIGAVEIPIGRLYKDDILKRLGEITNAE